MYNYECNRLHYHLSRYIKKAIKYICESIITLQEPRNMKRPNLLSISLRSVKSSKLSQLVHSIGSKFTLCGIRSFFISSLGSSNSWFQSKYLQLNHAKLITLTKNHNKDLVR